mgnify:CR=1 FL=1
MSTEDKDLQLTLKLKLLLVLTGTVFGVLLLGGVFVFLSFRESATNFDSLEDFRAAMVQRDDRDTKGDQSVSLRSIIVPNSADDIIYELKPDLSVKFQGVDVAINSHGMRYRDVPLEKKEGTYRVALLGDSFVFGWGVEQSKTFASIFEKELPKYINKNNVEVLNFGVPGYSTFQEVAKFVAKDHLFKPDAVVVYFIDNDFGLPFFIGNNGDNPLISSLQFVKKAWKGDDPEAQAKQRKLEALANPNKALIKLANFLKKDQIPLFLVINPGKDAKKLGSRLWALKDRKDIVRIGLLKSVNEEIASRGLKPDQLRLPTDPHPSEIKHDIIGRKMAEKIGNHLQGISAE